jgi:hypothetical protein
MEKKNNRMKEIAKMFVWIEDSLDNEKIREWEEEELKEEANKLRMEIFNNPSLMNQLDYLDQYKREYRKVTIAEYQKWIKE